MFRLCLLRRRCFLSIYRPFVLSSPVFRPSKLLLLQQLISPSLKAYPSIAIQTLHRGLIPSSEQPECVRHLAVVRKTWNTLNPCKRSDRVRIPSCYDCGKQTLSKVKFILEKAMKAQKGSRSAALLFP